MPRSIPTSATHVAPEWTTNGYGEIVALKKADDNRYGVAKKPAIPRGSSGRRPLGQRDPNIDGAASDRLKKEKSERDVINVQGLVRNVLGVVGNSQTTGNSNRLPSASAPAASPFQIYDETTESRTPKVRSISKGSFSSRSSPATPDDLIAQTQALSMEGKSAERQGYQRAPSAVSAVSSAATSNPGSAVAGHAVENDANILHQMLGHLETVMSITEQRKGSYHASTPQPVYRGGPTKWVTRYVDYTSKYGLGFLMNDGR